MHLLPHKSWNVYSAKNREKVAREEAEEATRIAAEKAKQLTQDRQARLELLRARAGVSGAASTATPDSEAPSEPTLVIASIGVHELRVTSQLAEDRDNLTAFRTADGHFDLFADGARRASSAPPAHKGTKPLSAPDKDSQNGVRLAGSATGVPFCDFMSLVVGPHSFLVTAPWYVQRKNAAPESATPPSDSWRDPIYDMGYKDRTRTVLPPKDRRRHSQRNEGDGGKEERDRPKPHRSHRRRDDQEHGPPARIDVPPTKTTEQAPSSFDRLRAKRLEREAAERRRTRELTSLSRYQE
ncbi:hypothetical protein BC828DRAFT_376027, partial [Blastocladiella britannica]